MPTARTRTFIIAALLLYFFANQTQVGWLYIMSALLAGVIFAAWAFSFRTLHRVSGDRHIDAVEGEVYEGENVSIQLSLNNTGRIGVYQIRTTEQCPIAAPDSAQHLINVFVPSIPPHNAIEYTYTVTTDRRGLHQFPPLILHTRAPFGMFRRKYTLDIPTSVLVYPEVRAIRRLSLLDYNRAQQSARPKSGLGSEVIGIRPFRTGDSPRHLHWRSMARTGQLMSKEFADEAQPGLALVLDLFQHPYTPTDSKHNPFEWAVKAAVTIADYARQRAYPLYIIVDEEALPAPTGATSWYALLQYFARVKSIGKRPLSEILERTAIYTLVAAVLPYPDTSARDAIIALRYRGCSVLSVLIDPESFPAGGISAHNMTGSLIAAGIDTKLIRFGTDWTTQLVSQEETLKA